MSSHSVNSIDFEGLKIVYDRHERHDTPDGQALVFIHGWACNSNLWRFQEPLFRECRALLIDLPGHGRSDAPKTEYSLEFFAQSVEAVLSHEEITDAVVIAHSMGGPVSTMLLRLFPERVAAIVYVDSFFNLPDHHLNAEQRKQLARDVEDDNFVPQKLDKLCAGKTKQEVKEEVLKTMLRTAKHVRINARTSDHLPHAWKNEEIFDIPALLIVTPLFAEIGYQWKYHIPNLEVSLWEDDGHFLFMNDPIRFNEEVGQFLAKLDLV